MLMSRSEIDIVVDDGAMIAGIVEQSDHLRSDNGVDGIVRTEDNDIVWLDIWEGKIELVVRMIFVKKVLRIVLLVEKSQGDGRFAVGKGVYMTGIHSVLFQETVYHVPHTVVACLADKGGVNSRSPQ